MAEKHHLPTGYAANASDMFTAIRICRNINDHDNYEEKCSVCGSPLKKGDGRFRTSDKVYCISCYYKLCNRQYDEDEEKAE